MIAARITLHTLVRTAVLAIGIWGYDNLYDEFLAPTSGDADIGKGLLAFLGIMTVSGVWALLDGIRHSPVLWVVPWVLTALAVPVGWEILLNHGSSDSLDRGSIIFLAGLVLGPALAGGGFGWLVGGRDRHPIGAAG